MDVVDRVMAWLADGGWIFLPPWCLAMSLAAYVAYWIDKSAAVRGDWRIKESTLHLFEVLGGWPGALLAQRRLHHKNRKVSYQIEFFLLVILDLGVLCYAGYRLAFVEPRVVWCPEPFASWIAPRGGAPAKPDGAEGASPKGAISIRLSRPRANGMAIPRTGCR